MPIANYKFTILRIRRIFGCTSQVTWTRYRRIQTPYEHNWLRSLHSVVIFVILIKIPRKKKPLKSKRNRNGAHGQINDVQEENETADKI